MMAAMLPDLFGGPLADFRVGSFLGGHLRLGGLGLGGRLLLAGDGCGGEGEQEEERGGG
jgi:hypothetical protein